MFKFGFLDDEKKHDDIHSDSELKWFPAIEIEVEDEQLSRAFVKEDYTTISIIDGLNLKLVRAENVVLNLKNDEHENLIKAESQHSDLLPAIYEGGLKVWECSYDLANYLLTHNIPLEGLKILDLGCGAGVLGLAALLKGSTVHFQDYNTEVIQLVTIPNVLLNSQNLKTIKDKVKFYSGDWAAFCDLVAKKHSNNEDKYDMILSSETIYNVENYSKLLNVFKQRLKDDGVGYIAGKTYYFGVGGGMRQFENLVNNDNTFDVENVWKSNEGLQREVIKLTRRKN